ncbi:MULTISPECIES: hypothetical protein [Bacillus]|uniref:hypothetical protein n=1 Tax=Bacillus TaxID=1386 RepID=UPI00100B37D6|nr:MULTISPECIES: hypothetical protein [Bacillus amyloliquefaciens group]MED1774052.1 hypothetical protein [Bacillus velezensis]RXK26672.1 hypothetical protein P42_16195 [Bacillus velezensis]
MTKTNITIKTSDKVEVTRAQAWAIERAHHHYLEIAKKADREEVIKMCGDCTPVEYARLLLLRTHFAVKIGDLEPWFGLYGPLNSMSADELNMALLNGYVMKEGAE